MDNLHDSNKSMTTQTEALKLADDLDSEFAQGRISNHTGRKAAQMLRALAQPEQERCVGCEACIDTACGRDECPKGWPKAAQPEQEPVAMKFKIYKPTVPDPVRQDINNALLPWVYDQDRSSGFDASMWVTPVATLTPQRKPLTDEQIDREALKQEGTKLGWHRRFARAIEAAHGIKE